MGGDGPVIDDAPAARRLVLHQAEGGLCAEEDAGQVHVDDLAPLLERQVFQRNRRSTGAGVVEEQVEPVMDVRAVVDAVLYMAGLPLSANVLFMTVMATEMPYIGRG